MAEDENASGVDVATRLEHLEGRSVAVKLRVEVDVARRAEAVARRRLRRVDDALDGADLDQAERALLLTERRRLVALLNEGALARAGLVVDVN